MTILQIITTPNPILKKISEPISEVNDEIQKIFDDMLDTMKNAHGAGLAAVQVGILKRLLIVDIAENREESSTGPIFMANPEITFMSEDTITYKEGCLSFPGGYSEITRPENIKVKYLDYNNNICELNASKWLARAIEHEMDHLNGIVMTDHMSKLKSEFFLKKIEKIKNQKLQDEA